MPFCRLSRRARARAGHGQSAGFVDVEGQVLQLDRDIFDFSKSRSLIPPR